MLSDNIQSEKYQAWFEEDAATMNEHPLEIVIVDDEAQITELLEIFIQSSGKSTHIHSFNDPRDAREYISQHPIDVIITDYKMPHVNGIDLLKLTSPSVKRILISGYVSEIAEDMLQQLNAIFFEKPVPMKELRDIVFTKQSRAR